jgi:hypothetical protein
VRGEWRGEGGGAAGPAVWTGPGGVDRERGEGGGGYGRLERGRGRGDGLGLGGGGVIYGTERKGWASGLCWAGGRLGHFFAESPPTRLSAKRAFSSN